MENLRAKLLVPTVLITLFCFGVVGYTSYQQYATFKTGASEITRDIKKEVDDRLVQIQTRNQQKAKLFTNNWKFIDNVTIGNIDKLLDQIVPFYVHKQFDIINIYKIDGSLLASAENPGLFGVYDQISSTVNQFEGDTDVLPVAIKKNKKLALLAVNRLEGNYGSIGYIAVGSYLNKATLSGVTPTEHTHGAVLHFLYEGVESLTLGDHDNASSLKGNSTDISLSKSIDSSGALSIRLTEDKTQSEKKFWRRFFAVLLAFSCLSLVVIIFSRKITLKVVRDLDKLRKTAEQKTGEIISINAHLEQEIEERLRAEKELHIYQDSLELRIEKRTFELKTSNAELKQEIAERKQLKKELIDNEARFRLLLNSLDAFVYVADMDTYEVLYLNDYGKKLLGDDITGKICWQSIQKNQSGPCDFCTNKHILDASGKPGKVYNWEYKSTVTGLWFEASDRAIEWIDGRTVRLEIARNCTDRKLMESNLEKVHHDLAGSEDQFRTLVENIPGVSYRCTNDEHYTMKFISDEIENLSGYPSTDFINNAVRSFTSIIHPDYREIVDSIIASAIANKEKFIIEYPICTSDGSEKWVYENGQGIYDDQGKILYLDGVIVDINDSKKAEEENKKLESQIRQSHKMEAVGTMAGGIAHDFNNILAAILGYADMAKDDTPDLSPAKHHIKQVLKAGNRAKELVSHILTFSRMSTHVTGHIPLAIGLTIKEVLKFQRSIIPTTISIMSDIDENCGLVKGDLTQVHQIVMNLCSNASHAMENQAGTLEVTLHKTELSSSDLETETNLNPGSYIKLSVQDNGTGMTQELINNIFDPYFTTKEVGSGSGMGLSVVLGIVKRHGGFVKVDSELGKGSVFSVFFPRIEEELIEEYNKEVEILPAGSERILFVDDESMLVDVGKSILERLGYSVTTKTDSTKALNLFKSDPSQFDLVITDQTMPNISGSQLANQLLQIRPDLPIILCTGHSEIINELKAQEIGIKEYAMKPVSKKDIAQLIRKVLDSA